MTAQRLHKLISFVTGYPGATITIMPYGLIGWRFTITAPPGKVWCVTSDPVIQVQNEDAGAAIDDAASRVAGGIE